ncbi:MaoC/PaaZ C-terminal domain-containing protein [Paraburkholderia sp. B3]|uniref:MaoC/PaaZ C-terminal domain-containing protein n=1 Tax=Paraburkholderia sp. B3 TaxID=3134791 RepID=UPI0039822C40
MPIDYATLKAWPFTDVRQHYTPRDTILYALGVGAGRGCDAPDSAALRYVYEEALRAIPAMAVVLGYPGFWLRDPASGIDWRAVLHVEQDVVLHRPLASSGTVIGRNRVEEVYDRGPGRGAVMITCRELVDADSDAPIASLRCTEFCRGEGGFGGPPPLPRQLDTMPSRSPDDELTLHVDERAALIYRLCGDDNPLHVDAAVARSVGLDRPILHGLCTFGMATYALMRCLFPDDTGTVRRIKTRLTSPVFPGERLCVDVWREGEGDARFRVRAPERGVIVMDSGLFVYEPAFSNT